MSTFTPNPHRVYRALQEFARRQYPVISVPAQSLLELVDRFRAATGDLRGALAAAVTVTSLLRAPILLPQTVTTVRLGEYLAEAMTQVANDVADGAPGRTARRPQGSTGFARRFRLRQ